MRKCTKPSQYYYLIMNKPCGYVCSAASDSHKTVYELLSIELQELVKGVPRGCRLHTVGRLDCDTSGLLLLTNDGKFSNRITSGSVVECPQSGRTETTVNLEKVVPPGGFDTASGLLNHRIFLFHKSEFTLYNRRIGEEKIEQL